MYSNNLTLLTLDSISVIDLRKSFDKIESSKKSDFIFTPERPIFLHACLTCSELQPDIPLVIMINENDVVFNKICTP